MFGHCGGCIAVRSAAKMYQTIVAIKTTISISISTHRLWARNNTVRMLVAVGAEVLETLAKVAVCPLRNRRAECDLCKPCVTEMAFEIAS